MFHRVLLIGALLILSPSIYSQSTIHGSLFIEGNEPLINATVVLLNPVDSTLKYFGITNNEGYYQIINIKKGDYLIQYSYVGAEAVKEKVTIPNVQGEDMGKKVLKLKTTLGEVTVVGEYVPIRFRSDTVEFNAKAFSTKPDAVVEDLLKKLPGIEVDLAGNIKALGVDLKKVLVNGKEFFGGDKHVVTKNLPADAVEKVEVFDKKSYESEFTGIDDGVRDRTINLELKKDAEKGYLGDVEAGGGTSDHYKASGKLYRFTRNTQIAALGMYNNINEFGFAAQNMGTFGSQIKGLNTSGAGGLNFSYNPTSLNTYYISYLGSSNQRTLYQQTDARYFSDNNSYNQSVDIDEKNRNTPHSFDFGIHHLFNPQHNLIFTGNIDLLKNDLYRITNTYTFTDGETVNNLNSVNNQLSDVLQGSANALYMAKLNEGKTQFKTDISVSLDNHFSGSDLSNNMHMYNPDILINTNQFLDMQSDRFTASFNPSFVQEIGKLWFISPELKIGINNEIIDQKQGTLLPEKMPIDTLSPEFIRENKYLETALTFKRSTLKSTFNLIIKTVWNQYGSTLWNVTNYNGTYLNLLPSLTYDKQFRTGRRLSLKYITSVNIPSAGQLFPVINATNLLSLVKGNVDLKPEYRHNLSSDIFIFDQFSYTSVNLRIGGTYTKDKISLSQTISDNLVVMNSSVNVPWDYIAFGYMNFSTPIRRLGINVNLTLNENWHRGINIINLKDNTMNSLSHSINFSIENHIKGKMNASLGSSILLTDTRYSIDKNLNNLSFNTVYFGDLYYNPNIHWNFHFTTRISNYNSQSLDEFLSIPSIDGAISYYFLKGNRGVLILKGIDLLDKNTGFQQLNDINYLMQIKSNTIGRYIMFSFKYRLTAMGKKY